MAGQFPPQVAPGRNRATLWGVLGIVLGLICCGLIGILFGYLSIRDARRFGSSPVLGWVAIGLGVVNLLLTGILNATGNYPR